MRFGLCSHLARIGSARGTGHARFKRFMTRRMPRPEDVPRDHIDAAVMGFLKGEKEADWTEVSLVTLHPREEIRIVLRDNLERYRTMNEDRFLQLLARLKPQGVSIHAGHK